VECNYIITFSVSLSVSILYLAVDVALGGGLLGILHRQILEKGTKNLKFFSLLSIIFDYEVYLGQVFLCTL